MRFQALARRVSPMSCAAHCLSVIVGLICSHTAWADPRAFDIPAGEAAVELRDFAKQSGLQLLFDYSVVKSIKTHAVAGNLEPEVALAELIRGTGLEFERVNSQTVAIRLAPKATSDSGLGSRGVGSSNTARSTTPKNSAAESGGGLEEIVVTAQKREERLQNVPISISVLSGGDLDKSTAQGITEALTAVPGVAAVAHIQGGGTLVTIRGVTASGPVYGGSSPTAYYLDTVPFGLVQTAIAPDTDAYDLERVEVLRGPQGTLYGASAQAGVVRVLTQDAKLDGFDIKGRVVSSETDGGSGNYRGDMAVNVPIVEGKVAARLVLGYEGLSGWIDNPAKNNANDVRTHNARLKVKAQPNDQLTISASAWISRQRYGAPNYSDDAERTLSMADETTTIDYSAYGLKVSYDLPSFSVASMTSYLDYQNTGAYDLINEGNPYSLPEISGFNAHVFSQEINLNSTQPGPWSWTAGGIYRDGKDMNLAIIPTFFVGGWSNTSKSYALFGELSRRFYRDKLQWTLGARYFHDDVVSREDPAAPPVNPPNYYVDQASFHPTTPRGVLTWYPKPNATIYASYSEGFRSGSPQNYTTNAVGFPAMKPDRLYNYEVGAKADIFGGRASLDSALFYLDWKDVQQQLAVPFGNVPGGVTALVNAPSASGMGVDLGLTLRPTSELEVRLNFDWNDLRTDKDVISQGAVLFAKGERLNFSPEYTAGLSGNYVMRMGGSGFKARFAASANYTSMQGFRTVLGGVQSLAFGEPMLIGRASFVIQAPTHWDLTLFADNINNEKRAIYGDPFAGFKVPTSYVRVRPRTIGLQFDYRLK